MHSLPGFGGLLVERAYLAAESGVVVHHVEVAEVFLRRRDHTLDVGLDRDVDMSGDGGVADALGDLLLFPTPVGTDHFGPLLSEEHRRGLAHP